MSKILKIFQCTNLGGMEQSAYRLLPHLAARNTQFGIATPRAFGPGKSILQRIDSDAVDTVYRGKFGWKSHNAFQKSLQLKIKDANGIWITGTDVASLRAVKSLKLPKLLGHHYHHFDSRNSFLKWRLFYEVFASQCDKITFCSDFIRNEAISIVPWIKNISDVVRYHFSSVQNDLASKHNARKTLGIPEEAFVVGNAGWLIPRKRWDVFLSVAERVLETSRNTFFILAGGGELEESLRLQASRQKHANRILFLGWMSDLEYFYRSVDVLLFNSDFDAFGRTPGEAMAYGAVPVVSLEVGGLGELVENNSNGFYFETHDVEGLSKRILELHRNPSLVKVFQAAGQIKLQNRFSLKEEVDYYINEFTR